MKIFFSIFNKRNKKDLNIFFAASPLHLICLNEYRHKKNIKNFKLILLLHKVNKHALKQIFQTLDILDLREYYIFWIPSNNLVRYIYELILISYLKIFNYKFYYKFLIIDFRNNFMHSLRRFFKNSKFTLLDDGFYTFVAQNNFMSKKIFLPISRYKSLKGRIVKFLYLGNSYSNLINSPIKLFTIYKDEINSDNTIGNDLNELRKKINFNKINFNKDKVFFTGTRMVEKGALKLEEELDLISAANSYWEKRGKRMYYVAKRSTSIEKLEFFNKNGIETLQFELPLELVFTQIEDIPSHICGLGSTLQKSLKLLFKEKINCYYIDLYDFFKKRGKYLRNIEKNEVEQTACFYSKNSKYIKTISIN